MCLQQSLHPAFGVSCGVVGLGVVAVCAHAERERARNNAIILNFIGESPSQYF
jgi:hypothetical protein